MLLYALVLSSLLAFSTDCSNKLSSSYSLFIYNFFPQLWKTSQCQRRVQYHQGLSALVVQEVTTQHLALHGAPPTVRVNQVPMIISRGTISSVRLLTENSAVTSGPRTELLWIRDRLDGLLPLKVMVNATVMRTIGQSSGIKVSYCFAKTIVDGASYLGPITCK